MNCDWCNELDIETPATHIATLDGSQSLGIPFLCDRHAEQLRSDAEMTAEGWKATPLG